MASGCRPMQIIDLTESYTLADHGALSNMVIEINDSMTSIADDDEPLNRSHMSRQSSMRYEVDPPLEIADSTNDLTFNISDHIAAYPLAVHHRKKSKSSKKTKERSNCSRNVEEIQIRKRSAVRDDIGECPICYERIGTKPLAATKCGHVFCQQCLAEALGWEKRCPTCRKKLYRKTDIHPLFLSRG